MTISITLQNDLVHKLESEARRRHVSVEELATTILNRAITDASEAWSEQNQRRLILIRRSLLQPLSVIEQLELDGLQTALDKQFESFDAALTSQLELMHDTIR